MYKDQFFCLKVLVGGPPFQHQRHLSSKLPWQNLTTILLSSVCLDVQSASSFLPTSPPKFLQPRGTDHPITNCRRLRRSRENFLRKSCPEFLQRSVDRISKTYVARDSDLQGGKGGVGRVAPLRPSYTQLALSQPQVTRLAQPMATGGKGGWRTSGWNNRKRKYLNIRHTLKTSLHWTIVPPRRYIYAPESVFQIHQQRYLGVELWTVSKAELAAGVEGSLVTKVGQCWTIVTGVGQ